jgi:hypothetical protein
VVKGVRLRLRQRLRSLPSRAWSRGSELRLSIPVNLHVSGSRSFFHNKITKPAWTSYGSETKASESDNLPDPDVLAQEIVEDLEAALEQFR